MPESQTLNATPRERALRALALSLLILGALWAPLAHGSTYGTGQDGLIILGCLTGTTALLSTRGARAIGSRAPLHLDRFSAVALLLLAWTWLSVLWAAQTYDAVHSASTWTGVLLLSLSARWLPRTPQERGVITGALLSAAGLTVGLALLQRAGVELPLYARPDLSTLSGPYFNPSHLSGYLIGTAALSVTLLLHRPGWARYPLLALLTGTEFVNLHTDSSSIPAVLLASALPVLVWVWTRNRNAGLTLTVLGVLVFSLGAAGFVTPAGQALFARVQTRVGITRPWSTFFTLRQAVWHFGIEMTRNHPLTGVGTGQFQLESPRYRRPERQVRTGMDRGSVNYAHSDALQMSAELGLPGALLFALLLLAPLRRGQSVATLAWWAACPALLFAGLYDAHLTAIPGTATGMLILAGLAARGDAQRERRVPPPPDPFTHDP